MKFYQCSICGNQIQMIQDSGMIPICCGQEMTELIPKTKDNDQFSEKHVPDLTDTDVRHGLLRAYHKVRICVGETLHPMASNHYIQWILLETTDGIYRKDLTSGDEPCAEFLLADEEEVIAVYTYCNVHGLWVCKD